MAKSPLPFLFAAGAFLFLKKKKADDKPAPEATGTDTSKPDTPTDTSGVPKPGGDGKDDAPKTLDDVVVEVLPPAPIPTSPDDDAIPVVNTSGLSGYKTVTIGEMMVIQAQLATLGHDVGKINGKWNEGGLTFQSVVAFQYDYDLETDGKPGPITRGVLTSVIEGTFVEPEITPTDYSGASGYTGVNMGEMMDIQKQLNSLGHNPGTIDGLWVYGGNTYDAVREFQATYGLGADGKPGPVTRGALTSVIEGTFVGSLPTPTPTPEPVPIPEPVPADDPTLFVINTKLSAITDYYEFKHPILLIEQERSSGIGQPNGFAYGWDIHQDQRTLANDGRYLGTIKAKSDDAESIMHVYRGESSADVPSATGRINSLRDKLERVVEIQRNKMT